MGDTIRKQLEQDQEMSKDKTDKTARFAASVNESFLTINRQLEQINTLDQLV